MFKSVPIMDGQFNSAMLELWSILKRFSNLKPTVFPLKSSKGLAQSDVSHACVVLK